MVEERDFSRRKFIQVVSYSSLIAVSLGMGRVVYKFLTPENVLAGGQRLAIGKPEQFSQGVTYLANQRLFVFRTGKKLSNLTAVCPHLGCTVAWSEKTEKFHCPCHGSYFDKTGKVLTGPANRNLVSYAMELVDGVVVVNQNQVVDSSSGLELA